MIMPSIVVHRNRKICSMCRPNVHVLSQNAHFIFSQLRVDKTLVPIIIIMQYVYTSVNLTQIVSYLASIKVYDL